MGEQQIKIKKAAVIEILPPDISTTKYSRQNLVSTLARVS